VVDLVFLDDQATVGTDGFAVFGVRSELSTALRTAKLFALVGVFGLVFALARARVLGRVTAYAIGHWFVLVSKTALYRV